MQRKLCLALSLLLMAVLSGGCPFWQEDSAAPVPPAGEDRPSADTNLRETVFYFPTQDWEYVVPLHFSIPWEEGIARATVNRLIDGQVPREITEMGFLPLLPAGTEIRGLTVRGGLVRIDFNRAFLAFTAGRERLLLDGLVYALTAFPTINRVEILVEGEKIAAFNGGESPGAYLDRGRGINLSAAGDVRDFSQTNRVTVYFVYTGGEKAFFVPVTRVIEPTDDKVSAYVTELLRGPAADSQLFSAIPRGIQLDDISIKGSRIILRLNGEFAAIGGGQAVADQIRDQLALTLTEAANIREVEVLVNGQTPKFPGGVTFPAVFGRPRSWNKAGPPPPATH